MHQRNGNAKPLGSTFWIVSTQAVFITAILAAVAQLIFLRRIARMETPDAD